jgi:hypothetical protein
MSAVFPSWSVRKRWDGRTQGGLSHRWPMCDVCSFRDGSDVELPRDPVHNVSLAFGCADAAIPESMAGASCDPALAEFGGVFGNRAVLVNHCPEAISQRAERLFPRPIALPSTELPFVVDASGVLNAAVSTDSRRGAVGPHDSPPYPFYHVGGSVYNGRLY